DYFVLHRRLPRAPYLAHFFLDTLLNDLDFLPRLAQFQLHSHVQIT
ncbi:hypothetical protein NT05LI_0488, partial [Listeria ivanovii FSL F6-596]